MVSQNSRAPVARNRNLDLDGLKSLAVRGLAQMFDPESQLFCYRLNQVGNQFVREGVSHRYTIMSLLGLHELESAGDTSPINSKAVLYNLTKDLGWIDNCGDLGLLLWLCARTGYEDLGSSLSECCNVVGNTP